MVNFVHLLAKEKNVKDKDIFSNSVQLTDGIIIKIQDKFYRLNLSADQNTYNLQEAWLTNPSIKIVSSKD
jgi:hypothetical protein